MNATNTIQAINLIAVNPTVRNGRPFVVGTTVTVADMIVAKNYHAKSPDEIADWYGLNLPQVYAGLSYYYDHKQEIDQQIREQIRKAEQLKAGRVGSRHSLLS